MVSLRDYQQDAIALEVYEACARRVSAEPRRLYLGMSQIGKNCERALWLGINGADRFPVAGRIARVFDCGHATEARVIADLRVAGYHIDGEQDGFSDFGGRFRGHRDGVIHGITKRPHLLEIKSANDASFKAFKKSGLKSKPVYEAQMQCYMGYGGQERGLFVVENKNNQELYTERVYFDRTAFEELQAKALRILSAKTPPEKCADETECRFCDYRLSCGAWSARDNSEVAARPSAFRSRDVASEVSTAKPSCADCLYFWPASNAEAGTLDIVATLRAIIRGLKIAPDYRLPTEARQVEKILAQALNSRPDQKVPLDIFYFSLNHPVERFTGILEYVLSPQNGYCELSQVHSTDPLTCDYRHRQAAGNMCLHPAHKGLLERAEACADLTGGEASFKA